jgi:hypothetical protein
LGLEGLSVAAKSGVIVYGNVLKENTPIRGVFVRFLIVYSLCGGYKSGRPEFIPIYMIYAALA